ncbi:hypothetical protein D9M69_498900 [compost metagenome]
MGLLDLHRLVALGLPVLVELRVVLLVQLAGRVVGHVEDFRGGESRAGDQGAGQRGQGKTADGHVKLLFIVRCQPASRTPAAKAKRPCRTVKF